MCWWYTSQSVVLGRVTSTIMEEPLSIISICSPDLTTVIGTWNFVAKERSHLVKQLMIIQFNDSSSCSFSLLWLNQRWFSVGFYQFERTGSGDCGWAQAQAHPPRLYAIFFRHGFDAGWMHRRCTCVCEANMHAHGELVATNCETHCCIESLVLANWDIMCHNLLLLLASPMTLFEGRWLGRL